MRIAIIAESAAPSVNGVARSVAMLEQYARAQGHQVRLYCPAVSSHRYTPALYDAAACRVPSVQVPGVASLPLGVATYAMWCDLKNFQPDIVHLASPLALGAAGLAMARKLQVPAVGVYQTDIPSYAQQYRVGFLSSVAWRWLRSIHKRCALTLAPTTIIQRQLQGHGFPRVAVWGRGVDTELFHPHKRDEQLRASWLAGGQGIVAGYVGRLAAEKELHKLAALAENPEIQLVIVGDGPAHPGLNAIYTGQLQGAKLARHLASFDVFVHPGSFETFCQTIQEAHASGVPTVAAAAGGPLDLVHASNGILLDPHEFATQVVPAVQQLATQRAVMCETIRAGVSDRSWEAICAQLLQHYEATILAARR